MPLITTLINHRDTPGLRRLCKEVLAIYGVEIPRAVRVGPRLVVPHRGFGLVIHSTTVIGADVTLYQGVTIGRGDPWVKTGAKMVRIEIHDGAYICAGAKILCNDGVLVVGARSVIGANAVLTCSTGPDEIWAGSPARLIRSMA